MNTYNNPFVHFLLLGISLLTLDSLDNIQVRDRVPVRNEELCVEEPVTLMQGAGKEDPGMNTFTKPRSFFSGGVQSYESLENEAIDFKFGTGIVL